MSFVRFVPSRLLSGRLQFWMPCDRDDRDALRLRVDYRCFRLLVPEDPRHQSRAELPLKIEASSSLQSTTTPLPELSQTSSKHHLRSSRQWGGTATRLERASGSPSVGRRRPRRSIRSSARSHAPLASCVPHPRVARTNGADRARARRDVGWCGLFGRGRLAGRAGP